jgi:hypothetical protein
MIRFRVSYVRDRDRDGVRIRVRIRFSRIISSCVVVYCLGLCRTVTCTLFDSYFINLSYLYLILPHLIGQLVCGRTTRCDQWRSRVPLFSGSIVLASFGFWGLNDLRCFKFGSHSAYASECHKL